MFSMVKVSIFHSNTLAFNIWHQAGTNNGMTHAKVLSAKVRRNERLWQTLDIGNMFGPNFGFKIPQKINSRN